ncbi:MAG TPA: universal stress protein, partial [Gemmatimonadales bacterium]|nr:universal stress protein [Gemmatimonadales bacterium]
PVSYPKDLLNQSLLTGVSVEARVLSGVPADAVLGEAGAFDASLLVLTSRGRGGVNRAVLGSVADRVIRRSEVPVLLVRPATPADDDDRSTGKPTAESLRGSGNFNRVLIPLDGSESAERVIPHVLAVAGTEDVHYVLMRAHPAPVNTALPSSVPIIGRELAPMEDGYLGSVAARMSEFGALVSVRSDRASGMTVPQAIVRRAQEDDVDLIAMTTRGLGGIDRMLFGSVAEHVLRHAPCSVLVLRPTEDDQPGIHAGANVLPVPR